MIGLLEERGVLVYHRTKMSGLQTMSWFMLVIFVIVQLVYAQDNTSVVTTDLNDRTSTDEPIKVTTQVSPQPGIGAIDGTVLDDLTEPAGFPEVAYILSRDSPPKSICLGAIFNSSIVYTADTCPLKVAEPTQYRVLSGLDVLMKFNDPKTWGVVKISQTGSTDSSPLCRAKILYIQEPGIDRHTEEDFAGFICDWKEWLDLVNTENKNSTGAVSSLETPPKAAAVDYQASSTPMCIQTYSKWRDPSWEKLMKCGQFCVFRGKESIGDITWPNPFLLEPGMVCGVGSPVFTKNKDGKRSIIGLISATKCTSDPPFAVAIALPEFMGLNSKSGTISTEESSDSSHVSATSLATTAKTEIQQPASRSVAIRFHVWYLVSVPYLYVTLVSVISVLPIKSPRRSTEQTGY